MARVLLGPKSDFQHVEKSLGTYFFEAADRFADKIFQIDADFDIKETFQDAKKRAIRIATGLKKLAVTTEDVVVTCSSNNLNNALPSIAALYIGAKIASLDPSLTPKECQHLLSIVTPKVIFVQENSVGLIEEALKNAQLTTEIVVMGQHMKYITLDNLSQPSYEEDYFKPTAVDCKETAIIFFSSGTTGLPKGICCSHYGLINGAKGWMSFENVDPASMFHFTSLYWITAVLILILSHITGGCRVLSTNPSPENALKIFETYEVTFTIMAPLFTYAFCSLPNFSKFNLKSLKYLYIGGTGVNPDQLEFTRKCFKDSEVQLVYGMTEASTCITNNDFKTKHKEIYKTKLKSSGRPYVETQIKIVDIETRKILGPNEDGEICFKSPFMFNGYHKQDTKGLFDEDGFLCTGDIGYYDEDEYVYIVDRIKEMFKYKSWHIIPTEIEQVLMEHPDVAQAVVFGVPHEIDGDLPAACIVLTQGSKVTAEEIHSFVNKKVNDRQKLRGGIKFVSSISKTPSGKFQRKKMKQLFLQEN